MKRKLKLTKPIVFFDLETTGISTTKDRIVQIAMAKTFPDGERKTYSTLINPGIPIPEDATNIHGISDNDVASAPTFSQMSKRIVKMCSGIDFLEAV